MGKKLYVINNRGEKEPFSAKKVYSGAKRAGASKELAQKITDTVKKEVYPGIETSKIFKRIKQILNRESPKIKLKFSLKEGIRKLGPEGFHFEMFMGEIFKRLGYRVQLNIFLKGKCLRYETDFLAEKDGSMLVGECKFRNLPSESMIHSNTALSFRAEIIDLQEGKNSKNIKGILATNTKFSKTVVKYANCAGIDLLGWKYPKSKGLEKVIDNNGFYPITILPSLDKRTFEIFLKKRMIMAKDLLGINPGRFSKKHKISEKKIKRLIKQAETLFKK